MDDLKARLYQEEDDFWRIRDFLREVFLRNGRREFSWPLARWDYWRWHGIKNMGDGRLEDDVTIWQTAQGKIAAVLNRESAGHAFLQVHPDFKSPEIEAQMITRAEEHLAVSREGKKRLIVWCDSMDQQRQQILLHRGYSLVQGEGEHQWRRSLECPIPGHPLAAGYVIRALGDESELPSRSWASWRAFHSDEPNENYQNDWTWYLNIQSAPLYRRDLDLVAVTQSGEVAAFTTIWFDDASRCGVFEPVGTMPEHQRKGLARALLSEGLLRLKKMGATLALVGGESAHANAFYNSVVGPEHDLSQPWKKTWIP